MPRVELTKIVDINGDDIPKEIINAYNDDMVQITIYELYKDSTQTIIPFDQILLAKAINTCRSYIENAANYDVSQLAEMISFGFLEEGADDPSLLLYEASLNVINKAYPLIGMDKYQVTIEHKE